MGKVDGGFHLARDVVDVGHRSDTPPPPLPLSSCSLHTLPVALHWLFSRLKLQALVHSASLAT